VHSVRDITAAIASSSGDAGACAEAFAALYDAKFDMLYRLVRRRTGVDEATGLDIVQDAMIRVIRHMKPMPDEGALDAWLTRVALTTAYDRLRAERRRRLRERAAAERRRDGCSAASRVGDDDMIERLAHEISRLDTDTFDLIMLRHRAGMTLERIGARLGVGPGAADGRVRRALGRLRRRLEGSGDG